MLPTLFLQGLVLDRGHQGIQKESQQEKCSRLPPTNPDVLLPPPPIPKPLPASLIILDDVNIHGGDLDPTTRLVFWPPDFSNSSKHLKLLVSLKIPDLNPKPHFQHHPANPLCRSGRLTLPLSPMKGLSCAHYCIPSTRKGPGSFFWKLSG